MLTPDQIEGAQFLAERPVAMLGDKAGFGKSAQFVAACDFVGARKITVVCPPILRLNEAAEFDKWAWFKRPTTILRTGKDDVPEGDGVVIVSYTLLATSDRVKRLLRKRGADVLILDEAHAVKAVSAARTKAIFQADGLARVSRHVWFITGTPTPNDASEYYVFAKCSGAWRPVAERLGVAATQNEFINTFCSTVETPFGSKILGTKNEIQLKEMLAPFVLARNKVDPNRPPLTVDEIAIEGRLPRFEGVPVDTLEAVQAAIAAEDWRTLDGPAVATVRRHIGAAKAEAVADLVLTELAGGEAQIIVFCEHTSTIDTIAAKLGDVCGVIDGRTPDRRREALIQGFQHGGAPRVLICQRQALKEGVNLYAATRVILAEPPWTPTDAEQMIARAWRRGQTRPVRASFVYLLGSFDERVSATLARKTRNIAKISLAVER